MCSSFLHAIRQSANKRSQWAQYDHSRLQAAIEQDKQSGAENQEAGALAQASGATIG